LSSNLCIENKLLEREEIYDKHRKSRQREKKMMNVGAGAKLSVYAHCATEIIVLDAIRVVT